MNRSVFVYAALLAVALVASYWSWTSETETRAAQGATIAEFPPETLQTITWETDEKRLKLDVRNDDRGRYVWVTATEKAKQSKSAESRPDEKSGDRAEERAADAGRREDTQEADETPDAGSSESEAGDAGSPPPIRDENDETAEDGSEDQTSESPSTEDYLASSAVDQLFENLNPLRAKRELTVDSEERRKAFGFDEPEGTLTVETDDGTRSFTVGDYTYGRRHLYLKDDREERYYVVEPDAIRVLQFGETRLRQKRVVDKRRRKLERVVVRRGEETVELVQHNPDDPSAAYWSIGDDDKQSRSADSWIRKLLRLQIDRFVTDERPSGLETVATVDLHPQSGSKTRLKLLEASDSGDYYARSAFTRKLVRLRRSAASTLVADVGTLLDGGTAPESDGPRTKPPARKKNRPPSRGERPRKGSPPSGHPPGRGTGRPPSKEQTPPSH